MRTCGTCTVCCTYLKIKQPELTKDGLTPCPHLLTDSEDGYTGQTDGCNCGANDSRPKICDDYACCWLYGSGADSDRPDRSGMLIDTVLPILNCVQAKPIREGAQDTPEGRGAVSRISKDTGQPALVAAYPETRMLRVVGRGVE